MNCSEITQKLHLFIDEELLHQDMDDVRTHLSACPQCQQKHEAEKMFKQTLREKINRKPITNAMVEDMKYYILNRAY
jgi:anti-sigma factor (TIGR02949 family)